MTKGVGEWVWIIAGISAGLIIFITAYTQISQVNRTQAEQRSIEQFYELKNIIDNLCWSFAGNKRSYSLNLVDTINGIYTSNDRYKKYSKNELVDFILNKINNTGNFLCIDIENKRLRCEQLFCNATMPFIGSVPEVYSLSALINNLMGRGKIFSYELHVLRLNEGVTVSFNASTTPTLTPSTTPLTPPPSTPPSPTLTPSTTPTQTSTCDLTEIMNMIDKDKTYSYESYIAAKPHPLGSSWNTQTRDWIKTQLEGFGLSNVRIESFPTPYGTGYNVIGELGNGVNEIVIGGHRDTVEVSPGAVDNTAGTSTVMEIARVYAAKCKDYINSKNYKLIFILFDGEEDGLLGSKYYVNTHSVSNTKYMLNFDCPAGYKYDVKICNWVTDTVLSNAVDQCCSSYNLPCEKTFSNFCGYDCSDYAPFEKKGVKHLFAVDLVQAGKCSEVSTGNKCAPDVYHTQNDNLNIIDKDKLVWAPKLGACVLRKLLP